MYKDAYDKLYSKDGERDIYILAERRQVMTKDLCLVKCIKDEKKSKDSHLG